MWIINEDTLTKMKLAVRVALGAPPANYHGCSTQETFWEDAMMKVVVRGNKFDEQCQLEEDTLVVDFPLACDNKKGGLGKWEATTPAPKFDKKMGGLSKGERTPSAPNKFYSNYHGSDSNDHVSDFCKPRRRHGKGPSRTPKRERGSQASGFCMRPSWPTTSWIRSRGK